MHYDCMHQIVELREKKKREGTMERLGWTSQIETLFNGPITNTQFGNV